MTLRIVKLCRALPENREGRLIGKQLFRSGTSIAANYRAACRGRSTAGFIAKLGIVEEEADETLFWLEMISDLEIFPPKKLSPIKNAKNSLKSSFPPSKRPGKISRKDNANPKS